ncbi:MAG TPA: TetR family transcriptional regulator [Acidimicrobiia bacterium]
MPVVVVEKSNGLTAKQTARRARVLVIVRGLAAEGGYDAVQMRDVAARAQVALGTLYRYFSSKDHLLASVWVDWAGELAHGVVTRPARGETPAERVLDVLGRATRALEQQPQLSAALVTALLSTDPVVGECQRRTSAFTAESLRSAIGDDLDPDTTERVVKVIHHVWFSALVTWVNGWSDMDVVGAQLRLAAEVLLTPTP